MSKIIVVMTCHNRREKTVNCLRGLHLGNDKNQYRYIVVDAGSTDGTCEELEKTDMRMLNLYMLRIHFSGMAECTEVLKEECSGQMTMTICCS